jgi:hypothetical protein
MAASGRQPAPEKREPAGAFFFVAGRSGGALRRHWHQLEANAMKMKTMAVLAGISAPLIMTASADAGFVGINVTTKPNGFNLLVLSIYAEFDNPGDDYMSAVAGTEDVPLSITVIGGTFYDHPEGYDAPPYDWAILFWPSIAFDSFYTIGLQSIGPAIEDQAVYINMPSLAGDSVFSTDCAVGVMGFPNSTYPQNDPFDPDFSFPGNGEILIGQFAMHRPTSGVYGIQGSFLMQAMSDGDSGFQSTVVFSHIVPTPGPLGLLGAAGLVGRRRRRK